MAIEFNCPECSKLLSVPDDSEGRQARCPSCSAVCDVPAAASASTDSVPTPSESEPPPLSSSSSSSFPDADNPYAAPSVEISASDYARPGEAGEGRNGPAWERDGKSVGSFVETVKMMFTGPGVFGRRMRRTGGLGAPIGFGVIGSMTGFSIMLAFQLLIQMAFVLPGGGGEVIASLVGFVVFVVLYPLLIILGLFLLSGMTHLMLMMLGGANHGFETTFRVIAYASGATNLICAIPLCGPYIAGIVQIVFSIFSLAESHQISGGKASAAVLIPFAVCCGLVFGGMFFLLFSVAAFDLPAPS